MIAHLLHLDIIAFVFINAHHTGFFDVVFLCITQLGNAFVAVPLTGLCLVLRTSGRTRRNALIAAALAGTLTGIAVAQIKFAVNRPRPLTYFSEQQIPYAVHVVSDPLRARSFPSGHTATAFGAATLLVLICGRRFTGALVGAALVAYSRMYMGVHFPVDTVAGALLGSGFSLAMVGIFRQCSLLPAGSTNGEKND